MIGEHVLTSDQWGTIGDGQHDDTECLQKFIDHVVYNKLKGYLVGKLVVTRTIKINSPNQYAANRFELHTIGGVNTNPWASGSCIHWKGINANIPVVEINEVQRSKISLAISNDPKETNEINGVLWRNRTKDNTASNLNEVNLYISGCNTGFQIGDRTSDGWNSNVDDNSFPNFHVSNTRHPLLIDGHAQDNNLFGHLHFGAAKSWPAGSRKYLIRTTQNGNGLSIRNGFMRTDNMAKDSIALDIQRGSINADRLSFEGNQRVVKLLQIGHAFARDTCVINRFTIPDHDYCDSNGTCIESKAKQGLVLVGGTFGGNVRVHRQSSVEMLGCKFREGYNLLWFGA